MPILVRRATKRVQHCYFGTTTIIFGLLVFVTQKYIVQGRNILWYVFYFFRLFLPTPNKRGCQVTHTSHHESLQSLVTNSSSSSSNFTLREVLQYYIISRYSVILPSSLSNVLSQLQVIWRCYFNFVLSQSQPSQLQAIQNN